jgi:hypothetical protein
MLISIAATAVLLSAPLHGQGAPKPALTLEKGAFVYRIAGQEPVVELVERPETPEVKQAVYRRNTTFAVWDERGLTIRSQDRVKTWNLQDYALTPKLFSRQEIIQTRALIEKGERKKEASALSGHRRIGGNAYFLVRWTDSKGGTWLEALVKVDLEAKVPTPKLMGRFEGMSLANRPIDDKLFLIGGALCAVTRTKTAWMLARFDPVAETFSSEEEGRRLAAYKVLGREMGIYIEVQQSGTKLVGRVDLISGSRRDLLETRLPVFILDDKRPSIAILKGATLHNLESAIETPMPADAAVRRTSAGVLVWWPAAAPEKATMLSPERWLPLAKWDKNAKPAPPKPDAKKPVDPPSPLRW